MLPIVLGAVLTAVLVIALARRGGGRTADLGSMSTNWVAANRAGERGSSQ
jgi:hypothetical protein